jgi:hypothetical protein
VPTPQLYDYAIIRVVPRPERGEFINAGVILSCPGLRLLEARIALDPRRLDALCPTVDQGLVEAHLASFPTICAGGPQAGPIGRLTQRERFHWLTAVRSAVIQTSPVHTGRSAEPLAVLERLHATMVRC